MSKWRNERRPQPASTGWRLAGGLVVCASVRRMSVPHRLYMLWIVLGGLFSDAAHSEELVRTPAETKAAFIKYIGDYTTWPAEWLQLRRGEALVICVVGSDPNGVIELIERRNQGDKKLLVNARAVRITRIGDLGNRATIRNSMDELDACGMLFFSQDSQRSWGEFGAFLEGKPILTISEFEGFARNGGMIELEFDPDAKKVFMLFNMAALKKAGFVVNALLLDLEISRPIFLEAAQ